MRVLLVKPSWYLPGRMVRYAQAVRFPPLGLGILAALSGGHEVTIADGAIQDIPYNGRWDLVAVTTTTFTSSRAYEIAARFRQRGIPVILGGVHASIMPEECLEHADAVAIGEPEYLWPTILQDAQDGRMAGIYRAPRPTNMADVPFPRRDLMHESSWFTSVEATRGCPNKCKYCYLPSVPWAVHRTRPVELVQEEIRRLKQGTFIFVDENLFADRAYAMELFSRIAPYRKSFLVQAPTNISEDDELLDALARAGCFNVQVGFQSFNPRSLEVAGVGHNRIDRYRDFVRKLHRRRIVVSGFFVFGFDSDTPDVFDTTVEAIKRIGIDDANLFVVTPFPGTEFYAQYEREGRLVPDRQPDQYGWGHAVFQPRHMTPRELESGVQRTYDRLHPYFRKRLKWVLLSQLPRLVRNPQLALGIVRGNLRRVQVAPEPGRAQ